LEDRTVPAILLVDPSSPTAFHTIQAAIDAAASSGDTIKVVAATYNEDIVINKSLTLLGMPSSTGAKPIIQGTGAVDVSGTGVEDVVRLTEMLHGVLVRGFDITSPHGKNATEVGVAIGLGDSFIAVADNSIHDLRDVSVAGATRTIGVEINPNASLVLINHNAIHDINDDSSGSTSQFAYGILSFSQSASDGPHGVAVVANDLTNIGDFGISINDASHDVAVVLNHVSHVLGTNRGFGIAVGGTQGSPTNVFIAANTVESVAGHDTAGIGVGDTATSIFVVGNRVMGVTNGAGLGVATSGTVFAFVNTFSANAFGVFVRSDFSGTLNVQFNNIDGNTTAGLENDSTVMVNARHNWWGSPSGPTSPSNPSGTGDKVIGPVDFADWLHFPI
jgi:hypothetical protein